MSWNVTNSDVCGRDPSLWARCKPVPFSFMQFSFFCHLDPEQLWPSSTETINGHSGRMSREKLRLAEVLSVEPIQTRGLLESIKRLQSWKDNGSGWHGWVILFLNQQLRLNINADKAEYSESRTALNRSPSNVPLAISLAFPGWVKTGNLIGPYSVPYLDYKVKSVWACQIKG